MKLEGLKKSNKWIFLNEEYQLLLESSLTLESKVEKTVYASLLGIMDLLDKQYVILESGDLGSLKGKSLFKLLDESEKIYINSLEGSISGKNLNAFEFTLYNKLLDSFISETQKLCKLLGEIEAQ